jgi:hypothetical protein
MLAEDEAKFFFLQLFLFTGFQMSVNNQFKIRSHYFKAQMKNLSL